MLVLPPHRHPPSQPWGVRALVDPMAGQPPVPSSCSHILCPLQRWVTGAEGGTTWPQAQAPHTRLHLACDRTALVQVGPDWKCPCKGVNVPRDRWEGRGVCGYVTPLPARRARGQEVLLWGQQVPAPHSLAHLHTCHPMRLTLCHNQACTGHCDVALAKPPAGQCWEFPAQTKHVTLSWG